MVFHNRINTKWVVVKFVKTKDFSVSPINWLVETNTNQLSTSIIKCCKWPQRRMTSDGQEAEFSSLNTI